MSRDTRFGLAGVTRRELLRIAGMAGVLGAVDTLAGTATRRGDAIAQGAETVKFKAWANVDEYLRKQFEVFEKQYAGIKVDYESYPNPKFNETMLANFLGDVESDMFFNRDDLVSAWSRAGYLRPLDDLPGMDAYKRDFFPFVLDALTVQGRIYGLPLVSIFVGFMYNQKMLKDGGFDKPPRTWDEATKQAVALKRQKVVEYPIVVFLKNFPGNNWDWWNLVYAHGGNLFDESFQPLFPEKDETALRVLEWLVDGIHTSKIVNPGAIELDYASARDTVGAGRGAFVMNQFSELLDLLDPKKSKAAADIRMGFTPGPSAEKYPGTPTGYTRLYSMNAKTKRVDATWKLMQFLGGKDARGEYYFPKRFFIDLARGYGYKTLSGDAEVKSAADRWMGANVLSIGYERAKARQALKAPWFSEWDQYNTARLQEAVTKRVKPRDALADSARKARELAKG